MRADFGKDFAGNIREHPNEPYRTVRKCCRLKGLVVACVADPGKRELRRALREMLQGPALKIEERAFPRGMHYLQNIGAAVPHRKMKVVVVFAGSRSAEISRP